MTDCVRLTPRNVRRINWLPPTCGYRLVAEGKDLVLVASAGVRRPGDGAHGRRLGARARAASEVDVPDEELEDYIVSWPGKWPKGARRRGIKT